MSEMTGDKEVMAQSDSGRQTIYKACLVLGGANAGLKRWDQAMAAYEQAVALQPSELSPAWRWPPPAWRPAGERRHPALSAGAYRRGRGPAAVHLGAPTDLSVADLAAGAGVAGRRGRPIPRVAEGEHRRIGRRFGASGGRGALERKIGRSRWRSPSTASEAAPRIRRPSWPWEPLGARRGSLRRPGRRSRRPHVWPPTTPVTCGALFQFRVQAGEMDHARETLDAIARSANLTGTQRAEILADGYRQVGDERLARETCQRAIAAAQDDTAAQLRLVDALLRIDDPDSLRAAEDVSSPPGGTDMRTPAAGWPSCC